MADPVMLPLVPSVPDYRFGTTLDGTDYIFDVRWDYRQGAWLFDVLAADDESVIAAGLTIALGAYIGARVADARFPPGLFIASDLSGAGLDAGLDDLGTRVVVHYFPAG